MISQSEHQHRRQAFFAKMANNSIAVIPTSSEHHRSADQFYPFYPDNDFWYLTGFPEPEAIVVLIKDDNGEQYILFNRPKDTQAEIWVGPRIGQEAAKTEFLADEAYPYSALVDHIPGLLENKDVLYYTYGRYLEFDEVMNMCMNNVRNHVRGGIKIPDTIVNAENMTFEMRLIKSEAELALMQKAADISAQGHLRAMSACKPGMNEHEIEAELIYEFHRGGCQDEAYGSIVGGGNNACILHYEANNMELRDGDLLLIDAAGRYHSYCADITRTIPVNGKYSPEQKDLYEVVLDAQLKAIDAIKPGESWQKMSDVAAYTLTQGLVDLKILKGSVDTLFEQQAYRPFYMHKIGHWLGLDVHDVGRYKIEGQWRTFMPGMVTTVEPGIYIRHGMDGVHKRWWGMGIRIEDDVAVTENGRHVLSSAAPKTVEEIEHYMAEHAE